MQRYFPTSKGYLPERAHFRDATDYIGQDEVASNGTFPQAFFVTVSVGDSVVMPPPGKSLGLMPLTVTKNACGNVPFEATSSWPKCSLLHHESELFLEDPLEVGK